ncbi:uncharacterized protein TM35_000561170 [Trypanosoma theileri]|uniref:Mucin TcMUCII n=1 Tax=Trypanosoma theileri TaxID=67003 RepID=A0A1X0NI12_9TRYP|nr:uncharacterized protein TM35_000561170 [Trypanosoma theileri]ORC83819.1 hypothetical protein TM35_000561170 [Trypanosoma theileri]
MTMAVMVRCYLLCLLTLALCYACGLVRADSPKASESSNCVAYVGVPPFFVKTASCEEARIAIKASEPTIRHSPTQANITHGDPGVQGGKHVTTNSHQEQEVSQSDHTKVTGDSENKGRTGIQVVEQTLKAEGTPSGTLGQNNPLSSPESAKGRITKPTEEHPPPPSPVSDRQQSGEATSESTQANGENPIVSESAPDGDDHSSPHENTSPLQEQEGEGATSHDSQVAPNTDESQGTGNKQSTTTSDTTNTPNTNEESTTTTTTTLPPESTNNKKGDADSSSMISSVWVRVALLIVVTLACILVCWL